MTHFRYWLLLYYHKNESLLYSEISMKGTQNAFNEIQMLESGFPWISLSRLCAVFPSPSLCGGASPPCLIMSEISSLAWFQKDNVCLVGKGTLMFKADTVFIWYSLWSAADQTDLAIYRTWPLFSYVIFLENANQRIIFIQPVFVLSLFPLQALAS